MPSSDDRYGRVTARHYDAAYAIVRDDSGDAAFYLEPTRESGGPVLELGCGTGRTLLPIAEAGIPCTGLDRLAIGDEPETEDARWLDGDDEIVRSAAVKRDAATQMMQVTMTYDRARDGERIEREATTFPMRYFFRYELEHLLARAGFADLTLYGGFDRREYGDGSPDLIYVAKP